MSPLHSLRTGTCLLAVLLIAACQQRHDADADVARNTGPATRPAPAGNPVEGTASETLPREAATELTLSNASPGYVTDSAGSALYALQGNEDGRKCDPRCEEVWPPVVARTARPQAGAGVDAGLVGVIPREDGSSQATYDGQPLYRYAGDGGVGRTAGHGVEDQWGHWSLLGKDGKPLPEQDRPEREGRQERGGR